MDLSPFNQLCVHGQLRDLAGEAVAVRILGRSIGWVDRYGVYHEDSWDPAHDEITISIPPPDAEGRPGPLS